VNVAEGVNETLTDVAKNVMSMFAFRQVLTYHMLEYEPSPEMQEGLDELVEAGLVVKEQGLPDMTREGVRYRAALDVDLMPYRKLAWGKINDGTAPVIRVFVKRVPDEPATA
jgi:hypothetical protein